MVSQIQRNDNGFMMATGIVALFSLVLLGLSISNQLNASGFFFLLFGLGAVTLGSGFVKGFSSSHFFTFLFWFVSAIFFILVA